MNLICKIFYKQESFSIQYMYTYNNNGLKKRWSLLESLEKHNIPIDYQCRSGYCGSCRGFLIKGCIQYYKEPLAHVNPKEILTCCCFPTESIVLKI